MNNPVPEALFDGPGSMLKVNWEDHKGQLVLIWARHEKPFTWDNETKDVIEGDVVVLDPPGGTPVEYRNVMIFPRVLQGQIRQNLGRNRPNLGRLQKGQPRQARQSPPWELTEPTEQDKQLAVRFLQAPNAIPADKAGFGGGGGGGNTSGAPSGWNSGEPPF